jgi:acylpyruvate hydrolase
MKLATVETADATTSAGRVDGDEIVLLPFRDIGELLASGEDWAERAALAGDRIPLSSARLVAPIANPSKIFCVGRNYVEHVRESGPAYDQAPAFPELFIKFSESLTGPYDDIPLPAGAGHSNVPDAIAAASKVPIVAIPVESDCVDWEAELVVVVGKTVRRATEAEAEAAIAGFTLGNDVSVRDWQVCTSQWTQGKAWEGLSPLGPVFVTTDEVGVRPDLRIRCLVDDEVKQDGRTSDMVFGPVDLVAYISRIVTLRPGDLIFTGTVAGVGVVQNPQVFLRPGQVLTTEVEHIGRSVNRLVADDFAGIGPRTDAAMSAELV